MKLEEIVSAYDPAKPLAEASTIPAGWYLEPDVAELERQTVFSRSWQVAARIDQLPEALPPVHKPRSASLAAAAKRSAKVALRICGNSDDQLPLYSPLPPSRAARQMPFQPVSCFSADQLPRMAVAPPAPLNVQAPLAAR